MIDVKTLLGDLGVDYKASGKNVGSNDINISCPFCGADKHLGINVSSGMCYCWVCEFSDLQKHPTLLKILMQSTDLPWYKVKEVMEDHGWTFDGIPEPETGDGLAKKCWLPKEACDFSENTKQRDNALHYLKSRGFNENTIKAYNLKFAVGGAYHKRIIIPVQFNSMTVAFTSRDYSGKQGRYKHAPLFMCSRRIKDSLYNYDAAIAGTGHAYLLEGPFDVWTIGDGAMAVFKSALSPMQRGLLMQLRLKSITIVFDPNATTRAYDAASALSPFIPIIKVVRLTGKMDVADLGKDRVLQMEADTQIYRG